jgi:hypothetical protein
VEAGPGAGDPDQGCPPEEHGQERLGNYSCPLFQVRRLDLVQVILFKAVSLESIDRRD